MTWKMATKRITKVTRATPSPRHGREHYCRDLNGWPGSWTGLEKDLPPGERLMALFRPFPEHLTASGLSPKTVQKHIDNMWALGGEFIRDLHNDLSLRKKPVDQVLLPMIEYGGPLLYHGDKISRDPSTPPAGSSAGFSARRQQRSLDSTYKKFHRFLNRSGETQN